MRTVFNNDGEPIGTERDTDPDEQYDNMREQWDREAYEPEYDVCYFCGETRDIDCMTPFEISENGSKKEVFACGHCESKIDEL